MMRVKPRRRFAGARAHNVMSVIFGMNTVVDATPASASAWQVFDPLLRSHAAVHEIGFVPFDVHADYQKYIRGRSRLAGVRDFLNSRDITLPFDDLRGLAMRQEEFFIGHTRVRACGTTAGHAVARTAMIDESPRWYRGGAERGIRHRDRSRPDVRDRDLDYRTSPWGRGAVRR